MFGAGASGLWSLSLLSHERNTDPGDVGPNLSARKIALREWSCDVLDVHRTQPIESYWIRIIGSFPHYSALFTDLTDLPSFKNPRTQSPRHARALGAWLSLLLPCHITQVPWVQKLGVQHLRPRFIQIVDMSTWIPEMPHLWSSVSLPNGNWGIPNSEDTWMTMDDIRGAATGIGSEEDNQLLFLPCGEAQTPLKKIPQKTPLKRIAVTSSEHKKPGGPYCHDGKEPKRTNISKSHRITQTESISESISETIWKSQNLKSDSLHSILPKPTMAPPSNATHATHLSVSSSSTGWYPACCRSAKDTWPPFFFGMAQLEMGPIWAP